MTKHHLKQLSNNQLEKWLGKDLPAEEKAQFRSEIERREKKRLRKRA